MNPGVVGMLSPCSARFEKRLRRCSAEVKSIALKEDGGFSTEVGKICELMGSVDMMIVSRPHEMTGAVVPDADLDLLITESDRLGKVLVIDEAYRDYTVLASPLKRAVDSRSTMILRTFSLYHALAGLRLGYGVGSSRLAAEMRRAFPSSLVNGIAPHGAVTSLRDTGFRVRTMKFIEEEKAYFRRKLEGIKGVDIIDTPCNFVLLALNGELERLRSSFHGAEYTCGWLFR